jgi:8-oxo-dGTP pyrophosphatase MutT (NUDIX family)
MTGIKWLARASLRIDPARWAYESGNRAKIEKHWKKAHAENPALHDGELFMLTQWRFDKDELEGVVQPASFASFLYWREQGYPEAGARNCFGSSVLQSCDGHILFGRMSPHTATAGLVYPVGGSFSGDDVSEGILHIESNIIRELVEETGLKPEDANREPGYICVEDGPRISLAAKFMFEWNTDELRRRIKSHLEMCDNPELDDVVVFRRRAFVRHHRMPEYARMLIDYLLPQ